MQPTENLPIDRLSLVWVNAMIRHTQRLNDWLKADSVLPDCLGYDRHQFEAIRYQLQMLLYTRPGTSWAEGNWLENFVPFLNQLRRRSQQYVQHLYELLSQQESV